MAEENVQVVYSVEDKGASKKIGLLSQGFQKLKDNAKLVAIAGIGLLTATITKGLKAFGVQEKAIAQLNQSLKNTGNYSKSASEDLQRFASGLQKVTMFGDETILQGQALIASFGFQGEELKQLTAATADLAAAKGMDFVQAADLVAKAVGSETNALSRYGVQIEGAAGSTERATSAVKAMTGVFGGQAQAQALTLSGSIIQLQNAWDDLFEEIGKVFAPMVQKIATGLKSLVERFNGMSDGTKKLIVVFGAIGVAILALLPLMAVMATSIAAISWPVLAVVAGVALAVTGFVMLKNAIKDAGGMANFLKNNFLTMGQIILGQIIKIAQAFNSFLKLLSKIPGVKLNVDGAIANLEKLDKKLEDSKSKKQDLGGGAVSGAQSGEGQEGQEGQEGNLENLAVQEDAKTELMLQKDAERNQKLKDQQAAQKKEKKTLEDELLAIADEEKLARQEEEDTARKERALAISEEDLAQTSLTEQQKSLIVANQERRKQQLRETAVKQYTGFLSAAGEEEKDIGKAVAQGTLEWAKSGLKAQAKAFGEKLLLEGLSTLPLLLVGDPSPLLKMAAGAAVVSGAPSAINSIQLAEGGSMIVDQPTRIGNNVLAGEAGPERIDVMPLNQQQPTNLTAHIYVGNELLVTKVLKLGQEMRSEGTLDDGL